MSSVLHPVGPEPIWIYWLRRSLILGLGLILVTALAALIVNSSGASAISADPPPSAPTVPTAPATLAPYSPSETDQESSSALSSATSGSSSASPWDLETQARPTASSRPTKSEAGDCTGAELRTTLTGDRTLKLKEPATFALSVINGSPDTCAVSVNSKNFELRIHSGSDRIWSTSDCATAITPITATLETEQAVEWQMTWDGLRSARGCKHDPESLGAGTYVATALLSDAKPVRLRMVLSD